MALRFDPEFQAAMSAMPPRARPPPPETVYDIRTGTNTALGAYFATLTVPPTVTETRLSIPGPSGEPLLLVRHTPASAAAAAPAPQPAVVYLHGGGMVCGSVDLVKPEVAMLADDSGVSFFAVGYRLAPEHPAPAGVEDSYAAVEYISSHAAELGIDPSRIAVLGISGGGAVAAGATLLARDRGLSPPIAKLVLVYPMLDDRTILAPESPLHNFLVWGAVNNRLAWGAVLGDKAGKADADVSPYAAPGRATDLAGLPRTYIDCGSLDLFVQESLAFAGGLAAADVEVELHVWPGLPHGFEGMAQIHWTKTAKESRLKAIRSLLDAE